MNKVTPPLQRTYPFPCDEPNQVPSALIISLVVFVIVAAVPLSGHGFSWSERLLYASGYFLICLMSLLINQYLLLRLISHLSKDWKIWHHLTWLVFNFFTIAVGNLLFTHYLGGVSFSLFGFLQLFGTTLLIGVPPVAFILLYRQNRLLKNHLDAAGGLDQKVELHQGRAKTIVNFYLPETKDSYQVEDSALLFIEAKRNYVHVHLRGSNTPRIFRTTLSNLEQQLEDHSGIVRCHRAFIVNLNKVIEVTGNSQGLQLHFDDDREPVPVSRSYLTSIKEQLG